VSEGSRYEKKLTCEVCGDHIGINTDHTECSKAKALKYGDSHENKHPMRRLTKKKADNFAMYYRDKD
jgi:hypothetical protein